MPRAALVRSVAVPTVTGVVQWLQLRSHRVKSTVALSVVRCAYATIGDPFSSSAIDAYIPRSAVSEVPLYSSSTAKPLGGTLATQPSGISLSVAAPVSTAASVTWDPVSAVPAAGLSLLQPANASPAHASEAKI